MIHTIILTLTLMLLLIIGLAITKRFLDLMMPFLRAGNSFEVGVFRLLLGGVLFFILFYSLHLVVLNGVDEKLYAKYAGYIYVASYLAPTTIIGALMTMFLSSVRGFLGGSTLLLKNKFQVGDELYAYPHGDMSKEINFDVVGFDLFRMDVDFYNPRGPGTVLWSTLSDATIIVQNKKNGGGRINKTLQISCTDEKKIQDLMFEILVQLEASPLVANKKRGDLGACKRLVTLAKVEYDVYHIEIEVNSVEYGYEIKKQAISEVNMILLRACKKTGCTLYKHPGL